MRLNRTKTKKAFTLMEVIIAAIVLVIAVIGTSAFRYQAALGSRKADLYTTAVRMGVMLCEGWAGEGGTATFNPVATFSPQLDIIDSNSVGAPTGFTELGSYEIIVDNFKYFATLSWKDMGYKIMALHIVISWDQRDQGINTAAAANKNFRLTTYVKKPS
jgi:hypothetical protein